MRYEVGLNVRSVVALLVLAVLVMGCQPRNVEVPDVAGMTQEGAEGVIRDAGLAVGIVTKEYSETVTAGKVISQAPNAGEKIRRGSAVDLVVSKGPAAPDDQDQQEGESKPEEGESGEGEGEVEGEVEGEGEEEQAAALANPPRANFSVVPESGPWPLTVRFSDLSEEGSTPIKSWLWDFGDGNKYLAKNTEHIYRTPGVYSVSLTIYSDAGDDTFVAENLITVEDATDTDSDGIPDWLELEIGTNPNMWDTSGDGISDGALYYSGADPLVSHGTLAPETVILESHPELRLVEVGADYLIFEAPTTKMELLAPGSLLAHRSFEYEYMNEKGITDMARGFIRRVEEVTETVVDEVRRIVVRTIVGAIQEVYSNHSFSESVQLTVDSNETSLRSYLHDHVVFSEGVLTVTTKEGRILLTPTLTYTIITENAELKEFSVFLSGNMLLRMGAEVKVSGAYSTPSDFNDVPLVAVPFPVPSLPVVVTLSTSVGLEANIQGEASVYAGFSSQSFMRVGVTYADGVMTSPSTLEIGNEFLGPEFDVKASFDGKVYLIPKLDISLYGHAGAYAQLQPYLECTAHYPCPPEPELNMGMDAAVGMYADLFVWEYAPDPITLVEVKRNLWTGSCGDLQTDPSMVATPAIRPYSNTGQTAYAVTLQSNTQNAIIRYTTSGAEPTEESPEYAGTFIVRGEPGTETTVKAKAWKSGLTPSHVAERAYAFSQAPVASDKMVYVPAGWFQMGRDLEFASSKPAHNVYLDPYYIGKYEVTNQEYADVLNWALDEDILTNSSGGVYAGGLIYAYGQPIADTESSSSRSQIIYSDGTFTVRNRIGFNGQSFSMEDHPMVCVSWYGAVAYCNWLSTRNGLEPCYDTSTWQRYEPVRNGYRLPTEAEWERAAAWDGSRQWCYGMTSDTLDYTRANYGIPLQYDFANPLGLTSYPYTSPVGWYNGVNPARKSTPDILTINATSPVGAYDMSGNANEWCHDWFNLYSEDPVHNPTGPPSPVIGSYKMRRGGSSYNHYTDCQSYFRTACEPEFTEYPEHHLWVACSGFRIASNELNEPSGNRLQGKWYVWSEHRPEHGWYRTISLSFDEDTGALEDFQYREDDATKYCLERYVFSYTTNQDVHPMEIDMKFTHMTWIDCYDEWDDCEEYEEYGEDYQEVWQGIFDFDEGHLIVAFGEENDRPSSFSMTLDDFMRLYWCAVLIHQSEIGTYDYYDGEDAYRDIYVID